MTLEQMLQSRIQQIRPRFLAALSERLDRLEVLRDSFDDTPPEAETLEEIRFGAHKTAGTAAPLGFKELGELASQCEQMIDAYLAGNATSPKLDRVTATIDDMLGEMALVVTCSSPD